MFVIAALAAFKGLSKIHTRSPCGDWMPVERPKCSPSCTWTPIGRAMLSSENQGFCRSGTLQKASLEGQVEPKWRLEATWRALGGQLEPTWSPRCTWKGLGGRPRGPKSRPRGVQEAQEASKWRPTDVQEAPGAQKKALRVVPIASDPSPPDKTLE